MIEINNLSKSYGINKIFENESITLTNSCIYALVGVNGIGKSTFLNSIIQPSTLDKGSVKIDDIPSTDFTAKYHYAFVPDTKDMFLNLTGKEYLQFVSELYNQKEKFDERKRSNPCTYKSPEKFDITIIIQLHKLYDFNKLYNSYNYHKFFRRL